MDGLYSPKDELVVIQLASPFPYPIAQEQPSLEQKKKKKSHAYALFPIPKQYLKQMDGEIILVTTSPRTAVIPPAGPESSLQQLEHFSRWPGPLGG